MKPGKITMAELRAAYPALAVLAEAGLENPLDPQEACWLDGPAFARWLSRHGLKPRNKLGEEVARRVRRWAAGDPVNLAAADDVLTELGHHIDDLPPGVWRDRPARRGTQPVPPLLRQQIVRERLDGTPASELAERYGVSVSAISLWTRRYGGEVRAGMAR